MSDQNRERFESMLTRLAFDFRSQAESETLHKAILHAYDVLQTRSTESNQEWAKRWKDVMNDRDQERRWKEAAQRESEKLAAYISELKAALSDCQETVKEFQK